ncbi:MAG: hypothetical protein RL367_2122 [Pseudomonadota bacterium]
MIYDQPHHRHAERARLQTLLEAGRNIVLFAPRRIGKTWLMDRVRDTMAEKGWNCIKIDVAGITEEGKFLQALCGKIEENSKLSGRLISHLVHRFNRVLAGEAEPDLKSMLTKLDQRDFLESLIEGLSKEEHRTLILIDEIALFVLNFVRKDRDTTHALLYHIRKLQLAYPKVQWFLTGSVGLDAVAERFGLGGALVDLDHEELEAFTPEDARSFIHCGEAQIDRANRFQLDDDAFAYLASELGWLSPYYLYQIASKIRPTGQVLPDGGRGATRDDVETAFMDLLKPQARNHFSVWREHIDKNFDSNASKRMMTLLESISATPAGEMQATLLTIITQSDMAASAADLKKMLSDLNQDGFIHKRDDRWCFQSGLLRRYWREYVAA